MKNTPLISVIIPCYNVAGYLKDSIGSVLKQSYQNIECIVVDDGSTDNTGEVVRDIIRIDNRVRYFKKENGGVSTARNYGISKVNGDIVQFLDSDDWLNPDKFTYQINYINENNISDKYFVVYTDFEVLWYGKNDNIVKRQVHQFGILDKETLKRKIIGREFGLDTPTPLSVCSTLFSRDIVDYFKFNEKMYNYGDLEYFIQLLYNNETKFYYTPIIGFYYRQREDSISKNKNASRIGYLQFLESIYGFSKEDVIYSPNMYHIVEHFFKQRDKVMYKRAMSLIKNTDIPVYNNKKENIRKKVLTIERMGLYYPYLSFKHNKNKPIKLIRRIGKNISKKILLRIGLRLQSLEHSIAKQTLPQFGNKPKNLRINLPRRIDNPQYIILGDNISIGPGSLLKTVTQYPGNKKVAEEMGVSIQKFSPKLVIGDRVSATASLQISALREIVIEDDVMFASNIWICDGLHGYENVNLPYKYQPMFRIAPIKIGRGCWIGQNVVIMPGVTIGELSIIGANSVVTNNIPDRSIAVGSPARIVKRWNEETQSWQKI